MDWDLSPPLDCHNAINASHTTMNATEANIFATDMATLLVARAISHLFTWPPTPTVSDGERSHIYAIKSHYCWHFAAAISLRYATIYLNTRKHTQHGSYNIVIVIPTIYICIVIWLFFPPRNSFEWGPRDLFACLRLCYTLAWKEEAFNAMGLSTGF